MDETLLRIEILKSCVGKTDSESRLKFEESLEYLRANDSEEIQQALSQVLDSGIKNVKKDVDALKLQIKDVYDLLPLAYIAETYFNKSRSWLYQRLNGYRIRGKVYSLNDEEKRIFNAAMLDLSKRIGSVQLS